MTAAEWREFGKGLSVGWPFRAWGAEFSIYANEQTGVMVIFLDVPGAPHRETGRPDPAGGACIVEHLPMRVTQEEALRQAFDLLRRWVAHEAAEAFLYRGARPFDPHAEEARPRGRGGP